GLAVVLVDQVAHDDVAAVGEVHRRGPAAGHVALLVAQAVVVDDVAGEEQEARLAGIGVYGAAHRVVDDVTDRPDVLAVEADRRLRGAHKLETRELVVAAVDVDHRLGTVIGIRDQMSIDDGALAMPRRQARPALGASLLPELERPRRVVGALPEEDLVAAAPAVGLGRLDSPLDGGERMLHGAVATDIVTVGSDEE